MKKLFFTLFLLAFAHLGFSEVSYLLRWNATDNVYEIKSIDLSNNALSTIGVATAVTQSDLLDELFYDQNNNRLIALFNKTDLWAFNLSTNTDAIIDLGSVQYQNLFVGKNHSYLMLWDASNSNYEIKSIDLSTLAIVTLGTSSTIATNYEISTIQYDETRQQLVSLDNQKLWKYDLTTNTDALIALGDQYSRLAVGQGSISYLMKWNGSTTTYELYEFDLVTFSIQDIGSTTVPMNVYYNLANRVSIDYTNHQLVSTNFGNELWTYDLNTHTDQSNDLGLDYISSLVTISTYIVTGIENSSDNATTQNLEIEKVYDLMGRETSLSIPNQAVIVLYKNGARRKIMTAN